MPEEKIIESVRNQINDYYQDGHTGLLLLSDIGSELAASKIWPSANETRTLREIVEAVEDVTIKSDGAFIAVVPKELEMHAVEIIAQRRELSFLRSLPRSLLHAFTIHTKKGQVISVKIGEKITYEIGTSLKENMTIVDDDLRIPGLDISDLASPKDVRLKSLDNNIKTWCDRHSIDRDDLTYIRPRSLSKSQTSVPLSATHGNALERLYAAQDRDVARKLSVPIDIALVLSRMP